MTKQLLKIKLTSKTKYALLAAGVIFALGFSWVGVSRQMGGMVANITSVNDPDAAAIIDTAAMLSPSDPMPQWLKASLRKQEFSDQATAEALELFREAVRRSPNDFRWWIELGRAYEQSGDETNAEAALQRSVSLAPNYTFPRWQLGNFFLRHDRSNEAFAEFKLATQNNETYREQVFSLAWDYFDKDPAMLEKLVADQPDVYLSLTRFYAVRGMASDALRVWAKVPDDMKRENVETAKIITQVLFEKRKFPEALKFAVELGVDPDSQAEQVTNGGFEKALPDMDKTWFNWRQPRGEGKFDTLLDQSVKHEGSRSVKITFRNYTRPELYLLGQAIAVTPSHNYRLTFWLRTEALRSGGPPELDITNGADDKLIASSRPFPQGTNDWQKFEIDFRTPEDCTGIFLNTTRQLCGENCPIYGTIWYDDFTLTRQ